MTRQDQNRKIIEVLQNKLIDIPNVQNVIASKFDEWFKAMVEKGQELLMQGQQSAQPAAAGGGGEAAPAGG